MSENEKLAMLRALSGSESPKASAPPPSPKSYKGWIIIAVLMLAAVAAWALLGTDTPSGKKPPAETASTTTPAAPSVAATPAGLTATGYVVARRIATVAEYDGAEYHKFTFTWNVDETLATIVEEYPLTVTNATWTFNWTGETLTGITRT